MNKRYWLKMTHHDPGKEIVDRFFPLKHRMSLMGTVYYYLEQGYVVDCLKIVEG